MSRAIRAIGHCEFTAAELVRGFDDLVSWVRTGHAPGRRRHPRPPGRGPPRLRLPVHGGCAAELRSPRLPIVRSRADLAVVVDRQPRFAGYAPQLQDRRGVRERARASGRVPRTPPPPRRPRSASPRRCASGSPPGRPPPPARPRDRPGPSAPSSNAGRSRCAGVQPLQGDGVGGGRQGQQREAVPRAPRPAPSGHGVDGRVRHGEHLAHAHPHAAPVQRVGARRGQQHAVHPERGGARKIAPMFVWLLTSSRTASRRPPASTSSAVRRRLAVERGEHAAVHVEPGDLSQHRRVGGVDRCERRARSAIWSTRLASTRNDRGAVAGLDSARRSTSSPSAMNSAVGRLPAGAQLDVGQRPVVREPGIGRVDQVGHHGSELTSPAPNSGQRADGTAVRLRRWSMRGEGMVIFGCRQTVKELATLMAQCRTCGMQGWQRIYRVISWFTLFFLPVLPLWVSRRSHLRHLRHQAEAHQGRGRRPGRPRRRRTAVARPAGPYRATSVRRVLAGVVGRLVAQHGRHGDALAAAGRPRGTPVTVSARACLVGGFLRPPARRPRPSGAPRPRPPPRRRRSRLPRRPGRRCSA